MMRLMATIYLCDMTVEDVVNRLLEHAKKDMEVAEATHHAGYHAHALFWAHLVLEKTCKGPWVSRKQEIRYPHTHSLLRLLKEAEIQIIEDQLQFFTAMNEFQSHGRYGDELERMEATVTPDLCAEFMAQTKIQMEWLIKQMHSR